MWTVMNFQVAYKFRHSKNGKTLSMQSCRMTVREIIELLASKYCLNLQKDNLTVFDTQNPEAQLSEVCNFRALFNLILAI